MKTSLRFTNREQENIRMVNEVCLYCFREIFTLTQFRGCCNKCYNTTFTWTTALELRKNRQIKLGTYKESKHQQFDNSTGVEIEKTRLNNEMLP